MSAVKLWMRKEEKRKRERASERMRYGRSPRAKMMKRRQRMTNWIIPKHKILGELYRPK